MTLIDLINATCWTEPQEHIKVSLFDKEAYTNFDDEHAWEEIDLNVHNLAKYGNCEVNDIDVEDGFLVCCVNV